MEKLEDSNPSTSHSVMKMDLRQIIGGGGDETTSTEKAFDPKIGSTQKASKLKIDKMAWINYFKMESKKIDSKGKRRSRLEIAHTWNSLTREVKATYGQPFEENVPDTNILNEQPDHNASDLPIPNGIPPIDEAFAGSEICMGNDNQIIKTRCTPSRLRRIVDRLSEEQKEAVRGLGFGNLLLLRCGRLRLKICGWLVSNFDTESCSLNIHGKTFALHSSLFAHVMGIADIGDPINIYGDVPNKEFWESKFAITSRGIFIKDIETHLEKITTSDYEFKVTFCLFLLGTILAPTPNNYVNVGYLIPLSNVDSIRTKNWSNWCFTLLCDGIKKYKGSQNCWLSGCLLFLQLFYFHSIQWEPPIVDIASIPVVRWTNRNIKKCLLRLHTAGGVGSNQVVVRVPLPQAAHAANSEFDPPHLVSNAAHGTSAGFNSQPGSSNSANPIDPDSKLQMMVKEMELLRAELQEVKSKMCHEKSAVSRLMDEKIKLHEEYTKDIRNALSINKKQKHDMDCQKKELEQQAKKLEECNAQKALERRFLMDEIEKLKGKLQNRKRKSRGT